MAKQHILITFICMAILFFSSVSIMAEMIVDTAWVSRYDGPLSSWDVAYAMTVDDSGNVYVTGGSEVYNYEPDYVTFKYDQEGRELWASTYDWSGLKDNAFAIAVDYNGNIYVTGEFDGGIGTRYDFGTVKYLPNGDTAWVRTYDGAVDDADWAWAIAVDGSGNVFVTGFSVGLETYQDYATIKYLPNGDTAWMRKYNGPGNNYDEAWAIAVDGAGNTYVTGCSDGGTTTGRDYATIKYLTNGDTAWLRRYNGSGSGNDGAQAIAVDDSGNVYVAGNSGTVKYNPTGDLLWAAPWGGTDMVMSNSSNVHVVYGNTVTKYYPNGDTAWVRQFDGGGSDIALDSLGNVYITGSCAGEGGDADYATAKYAANGNLIWMMKYDSPGHGNDYAWGLAVDGCGNACVTGRSEGVGASYDYATIKYVEIGIRGDVNQDGVIDPADIVYFINYLFRDGDPPDPLVVGDCNFDGEAGPADVVFLINYFFRNGPPPDRP
jgi:hypothetical protein